MLTLRRCGAVVGAGLLLMLTSCSSQGTLRTTDVQEQIASALGKQVGGTFTVTCPTALPAEQGYAFTCTAVDGTDGFHASIAVTEADDAGGFTWTVTSVDAP